MKKVIVVSKTHLDLGFTDYAENIRLKYINTFIPSAIELADRVNTDKNKNFIWTIGSWILKEALEHGNDQQKSDLVRALQEGSIAPHALPFTTHSELLDKDTFEYGLSIVDKLDKIRGSKTIAAKMTDVPGHTAAIVPLLAKHGIKLLHIGVNGVSAVPEVPECFLWKYADSEVIVIYSGDYGGAFKSNFAEEVLYIDHTLDNHGAPSPKELEKKFLKIQKEYPDYTVCAGTLDEFAEIMWKIKDKLPVFEGEIGDSWIHGSASDPYKSAALRALMRLKKLWLSDGTMERMSNEYIGFTDALLCIGEHTCGMDSKIYLSDYNNYLKKDFQRARKKDIVVNRHPLRSFPQCLFTVAGRLSGAYKKGSYKVIEKSWQEQRTYIDKALTFLSDDHRAEAEAVLSRLVPEKIAPIPEGKPCTEPIIFGGYIFTLNTYGGIGHLTYNGGEIIRENNEPVIEYRSYAKSDYDFWFAHYARNLDVNFSWGYADFGRPQLKHVDGKYPTGRFFYTMNKNTINETPDSVNIYVQLNCQDFLCTELGAPRNIQIIYTLNKNGIHFSVSWFGKDANRLTESTFLHLYPSCSSDNFKLVKLGEKIDYQYTVSMGGRNLHAVENSILKTKHGNYSFQSLHAPLISIGYGKILRFDNQIGDIVNGGISYVLHNNVWGTNFPLWYEDNAFFEFVIIPEK